MTSALKGPSLACHLLPVFPDHLSGGRVLAIGCLRTVIHKCGGLAKYRSALNCMALSEAAQPLHLKLSNEAAKAIPSLSHICMAFVIPEWLRLSLHAQPSISSPQTSYCYAVWPKRNQRPTFHFSHLPNPYTKADCQHNQVRAVPSAPATSFELARPYRQRRFRCI